MARRGFRYVPGITGGLVVNPMPCVVASAYGTALYPGTPVIKVSDGTVAIGAGTSVVLGIIDSIVQYRNADGVVQKFGAGGGYLPATTPTWTAYEDRTIVNVIPCLPGVFFAVPCDDATTFTTLAGLQAAVWENCDGNATAFTANTALGLGTFGLDISTHAVTNTLQWRIVGIMDSVGNDPAGGANYEVIVECNLPQLEAILGV
jgi:hypothetical protein